MRGETSDGESSVYTYNALGVRIANTQVRANENARNRNSDLKDGSHDTDYLDYLADGREAWQRAWETEVGTTVQPDTETVTRRYVVDYLSAANRDIFVVEEGSYTQRFVYDEKGMRVTAEFDYAPNTQRGEGGENLQSDIAVGLGKIWYKNSQIGTAVYAVDSDCKTVSHMVADMIEISNNYLSGIERGKEKPSLEILMAVCSALKTTPDYLTMGTMRSNNVPESIMQGLRLCSQEDIELLDEVVKIMIDRRSATWSEENFV